MNKQMDIIAYTYIAITVLLTVLGQLSVKWAMLQIGVGPNNITLLPQFILKTFTNLWFIVGMASAVLAAVSWSLALSRSNLSFAYPFMASAIVLVLIFSSLLFGEQIPVSRWLGVLVVGIGIFLASR